MKPGLAFLSPLVFIVLLSCNKDSSDPRPYNGGTLLVQIRTHTNYRDSSGFQLFHYDNKGKLLEVVDSLHMRGDNSSYLDVSLQHPVLYDQQGRVSHYFYRTRLGNDAIYDSLVYDNAGKVIKRITINELEGKSSVNLYRYNDLNELIVDSTVKSYQPGPLEYTTFQYEYHGDLVATETFSNSSGQFRSVSKSTFSYGTAYTPTFPKLSGKLIYMVTGDLSWLSFHVLSQENHSDGVSASYQEKVFSSGLPSTLTKVMLAGGKTSVHTIDYYYD